MKLQKLMTLGLFTMAAGIFLAPDSLDAWERSYPRKCKKHAEKNDAEYSKQMKDCKMKNGQDAKDCKARAEKNRKENDDKMARCKKDSEKDNMATFEAALSPFAAKQYQTFNRDQRVKAMDYADKNAMTPDDAVSRVFRKK